MQPLLADRAPFVHLALRTGRRLLTVVAGGMLLVLGGALLVLPGPGTPVLLGGLALLATEFAWADRALGRATAALARLASRRPSRAAVRQAMQAALGCAVTIGGIAGVDELAGLVARV